MAHYFNGSTRRQFRRCILGLDRMPKEARRARSLARALQIILRCRSDQLHRVSASAHKVLAGRRTFQQARVHQAVALLKVVPVRMSSSALGRIRFLRNGIRFAKRRRVLARLSDGITFRLVFGNGWEIRRWTNRPTGTTRLWGTRWFSGRHVYTIKDLHCITSFRVRAGETVSIGRQFLCGYPRPMALFSFALR